MHGFIINMLFKQEKCYQIEYVNSLFLMIFKYNFANIQRFLKSSKIKF